MSQINPQIILDKKILISCEYTKLAQVGIDLTISEDVEIKHGLGLNILLNEIVKLPDDVYAMIYGRSSFNRKAVLIRGSVYDNNYEGKIGVTIYNMSGETLIIKKNERICQMVFSEARAASKYCGHFQGEGL